MTKTHHFLLLRHCVRTTGLRLDLGVDGDASNDQADYMADRGAWPPNWNAAEMDCTAVGNDLVHDTGKWLIKSGFFGDDIDVSSIEWEIITDASHRDVDTAFFLSEGMRDAAHDIDLSVADITVEPSFSRSEFCTWEPDDEPWAEEVEARMANLPRPTLSFEEAMNLWQELLGVGRAGVLRDSMPVEPSLNYDNWSIQGAASFLYSMGETLLHSRASEVEPVFAPAATIEQVYQLYEFVAWYRAVRSTGNSEVAVWGAWQGSTLLRVLRHGFYQRAPRDYSKTARVTIILGHDGDIDTFATAMDARWELDSPYGYPSAVTATPPLSGIHAVRDVEKDTIDMSFVYPTYSKMNSQGTDFKVDRSGVLHRAPIWLQEGFGYVGSSSTRIHGDQSADKSSSDVLEDYLLEVVGSYAPQAVECYHDSQDYWKDQTQNYWKDLIQDSSATETTFNNDGGAEDEISVTKALDDPIISQGNEGDKSQMTLWIPFVSVALCLMLMFVGRQYCKTRSDDKEKKTTPVRQYSSVSVASVATSTSSKPDGCDDDGPPRPVPYFT